MARVSFSFVRSNDRAQRKWHLSDKPRVYVPGTSGSIARIGRTRTDYVNYGYIVAASLTPKKARILLILALSTTSDPAEIQRMAPTY